MQEKHSWMKLQISSILCNVESSLVREFWCNEEENRNSGSGVIIQFLSLPSVYLTCIIMFHTLCIWEGNIIDWNTVLNRLSVLHMTVLFNKHVSNGLRDPEFSYSFSCCSPSFWLTNVLQRQYMQTGRNPAVECYSIINSLIPSSIIYLSYHSIGSLDCGKTLQCRRTLLCLLHCSGTPCRLHCLAPNDVSSKWAKHRWWAWLNFC